ncbi:MAG: thiamine pyrophosphate-dependent enzyme, partial [Anaerolineales bacterium]
IPDAEEKVIVQCTVDTADVNNRYRVDHAVIGDAAFTLQGLIGELEETGGLSRDEALIAEITDIKEDMMAKYRLLMESTDKPINPYRVYKALQETLDPKKSFLTHDSGNTRDQLSTVYQALSPRSFMGWGDVSTLGFGLAAATAAKLAHPEWQCVNVTGDAGVGYMLGNLEALVRQDIGVTTVHINNGGFSGYGPGFWGEGHDPYTCEVSDHAVANMAEAVGGLGYYSETVSDPAEVIPALKRAFAQNAEDRPAYLEVLCSQYPVFGEWVREGEH